MGNGPSLNDIAEHVQERLEVEFVLIKKSKFYYVLGGFIATIIAIFGITYANVPSIISANLSEMLGDPKKLVEEIRVINEEANKLIKEQRAAFAGTQEIRAALTQISINTDHINAISTRPLFHGALSLHDSSGDAALLTYSSSVGSSDFNNSTFVAPESGVYVFLVSYTKEAGVDISSGETSTGDDVYVRIRKNNTNVATAFSGEHSHVTSTGRPKRTRDSTSNFCLLELKKDDRIDTVADSDGHYPRRLKNIYFAGFKISDR